VDKIHERFLPEVPLFKNHLNIKTLKNIVEISTNHPPTNKKNLNHLKLKINIILKNFSNHDPLFLMQNEGKITLQCKPSRQNKHVTIRMIFHGETLSCQTLSLCFAIFSTTLLFTRAMP
jgi:hypothetical protein